MHSRGHGEFSHRSPSTHELVRGNCGVILRSLRTFYNQAAAMQHEPLSDERFVETIFIETSQGLRSLTSVKLRLSPSGQKARVKQYEKSDLPRSDYTMALNYDTIMVQIRSQDMSASRLSGAALLVERFDDLAVGPTATTYVVDMSQIRLREGAHRYPFITESNEASVISLDQLSREDFAGQVALLTEVTRASDELELGLSAGLLEDLANYEIASL